jgi:hypothetical protein
VSSAASALTITAIVTGTATVRCVAVRKASSSAATIVSSISQRSTLWPCQPLTPTSPRSIPTALAIALSRSDSETPYQLKKNMKTNSAMAPPAATNSPRRSREISKSTAASWAVSSPRDRMSCGLVSREP